MILLSKLFHLHAMIEDLRRADVFNTMKDTLLLLLPYSRSQNA
jgi:hypothetical protein